MWAFRSVDLGNVVTALPHRDQLTANHDKELLLAVTKPTHEAREALRKWRSHVELDDVAHPATTLLPLLALRVDEIGDQHRDEARIRGLYRYSWTRNQAFHAALQPVLEEVARIEIAPAIVCRELAVQEVLGWPAGARPIERATLLVDDVGRQRLVKALANRGWSARPHSLLRGSTALHLGDTLVELATRIGTRGCADVVAAVHAQAKPYRSFSSVRCMTRGHLFFDIACHAWAADPIRWTPELLRLIELMDESDLVQAAHLVRVTHTARKVIDVLTQLETLLSQPCGRHVQARLAPVRDRGSEVLERQARRLLPSSVIDSVYSYRFRCRERGVFATPWNYAAFLAESGLINAALGRLRRLLHQRPTS